MLGECINYSVPSPKHCEDFSPNKLTQSLYSNDFCKKLRRSIFGFHRLLWKLKILTLLEHLSLGKVWACLSTRLSYHHAWMQLAFSGVIKLRNKLQVLSLHCHKAITDMVCISLQDLHGHTTNMGHNMPQNIRFWVKYSWISFFSRTYKDILMTY